MRTRKIPRGARRLRTYAEFQSYLSDFVQGIYPFLWIVGRPGLAKTESIRAAVCGQDVYTRKGGQLTPLQFYRDCYEYRDRPVILDDAEHLLDNKIGAKLISALGDTTPTKMMSYATTSRALGEVPQSFSTSSSLCVLANKVTADEAVQSRAVILSFDPTNLEIHRAVAGWFWDQEIHDWFGQHLYRLPSLDTRWYLVADRDKQAGRNWRQNVLKDHAPSRTHCVVQDLENDPAFPTREDKARRFTELMGTAKGASRASYFRIVGRLEQEGRLTPEGTPPIPLRRTRRPGRPSLLELEAMDVVEERPEEEPQPSGMSPREQFTQPIRGQVPTQAARSRLVLDDSLSWETPQQPDEGDEV